MKKVLLLFFIMFVISCDKRIYEENYEESTIYESLSLEETSLELKIGDNYQLKLSYSPSDLSAPECTYASSSPGVVNVDENGLLTALSEGRAKITVTPASELNLTPCECDVVVKPVLSQRITLSETTLTLKTGDSRQLTFEIYPSGTSNKRVEWESTNSQVATVNNGLVTAVAPGSSIIRIKASDGGASAECRLTVNPPSVESVAITNDVSAVVLMSGETFQLEAEVRPENAGNKNVVWSIGNNSIASISTTGLITARSIGETTATVTTVDGNFTATMPVRVTDITGFVTAYKSGSATSSIGGYVTGNVNSTIINRHKTKAITVTKFEVVDNKTNQVVATKTDELGQLSPNATLSMSFRMNSVFEPNYTFKWYYTYEGKEYVGSHLL
jgi:uncharacterized protein YjdB